MENGFVENGFIVNLSNARNAADVIYELSSILDMPETKNKKILNDFSKVFYIKK